MLLTEWRGYGFLADSTVLYWYPRVAVQLSLYNPRIHFRLLGCMNGSTNNDEGKNNNESSGGTENNRTYTERSVLWISQRGVFCGSLKTLVGTFLHNTI